MKQKIQTGNPEPLNEVKTEGKYYKLYIDGKDDSLRKDSFTFEEAINVVANVLRLNKKRLYVVDKDGDRPLIRMENNPHNVDAGYSHIGELRLIKE